MPLWIIEKQVFTSGLSISQAAAVVHELSGSVLNIRGATHADDRAVSPGIQTGSREAERGGSRSLKSALTGASRQSLNKAGEEARSEQGEQQGRGSPGLVASFSLIAC